MQNIIKSLNIFIALFSIMYMCNSCCREVNERSLSISFEDFDFSKLDDVLLITTPQDDLSQVLNTAHLDLTNTHYFNIIIYDDNSLNKNYIIKDVYSGITHTITAIHTQTYKRTISTSMCKEWKYSFTLDDSIYYGDEYNHVVFIQPE